MQQPQWGPPAGGFGAPYQPQGFGPYGQCSRCGQPGPDHTYPNGMPVHRPCAGLGPDTLHPGWIVLAYLITIPLGCSLIGAALASIPYYLWKRDYPNKARAYNRHVWIAFAISCVLWISLQVMSRR